MENRRSTKRPAEEDQGPRAPKRRCLSQHIAIEAHPVSSAISAVPSTEELSNQRATDIQSPHPQSVTASETIPHDVTSAESQVAVTEVAPITSIEARLLPIEVVDAGQMVAYKEATKKTKEAIKNGSHGISFPGKGGLESKDSKRSYLDMLVDEDGRPTPDSISNMEVTANQYPIGIQSSHPKSVTASQAISHDVTSIEPPEILIDVTPSAPGEGGLPPIQTVGHLTSCTAIQGEQIVAKEDVSKESLRGQVPAPSANKEATAKTKGEPKNTSSGTKRPGEDGLESKDPKRPRLDIPAGVESQAIPYLAPNMEANASQYPIGTQTSNPKSVTASQVAPHDVTFIEHPDIPIDVTPRTSVEASLLPNPETDYFVSSTAIYGEQQATRSEITVAPPLKGIPANKYPSVESVHKKILGPKARAEAARKEAEAREEAFFGPKVPTTQRVKKSSAVNKKARSGISKAGPQRLATPSAQMPATRTSPVMKFLFSVDADTPKERVKSSAALAASLDFTANSERLLAMLRESRPASKVKRSGTALLPIVVDDHILPEEAESGYAGVGGGRSDLKRSGDELEMRGHSDSKYYAATLSRLREPRKGIARAGAPEDVGLMQLQEPHADASDARSCEGGGRKGTEKHISKQQLEDLQFAQAGGASEESFAYGSCEEAAVAQATEIEEEEASGYEGDEDGASNDTSSEGEEVVQFEDTESVDGECSGNDHSEETEFADPEDDGSSKEVEFVEPEDDIFGPGWCNGAGPVPPEEDEDWDGGTSDSSYKESSSGPESSEDGGGQEEGRGPLQPRRIIYLAPDRFAEQVLRRRAPMYGVDTHTTDAEDVGGLSSDEGDCESEGEERSTRTYPPYDLGLPYYAKTLIPTIVEKTSDFLEDGESDGIVGDKGKAAVANDVVDIADDATKEEVLARIPLPSDLCFRTPRSVRYIPRGNEYTDIIYELEWSRGYTRKQTMWLLGADRPGEKEMNTKLLYMRLFRHRQELVLLGSENAQKLPSWKKRTAPDTAGGAKVYTPGRLEELAMRYGEESLVPASGDWELDLVPQWARRIWRLFARACKLKNLGTPEGGQVEEAIADLLALASAWGLSDTWVVDDLEVGYNTIGMYQLLPSFDNDGVMKIEGEDHCVLRFLHQHIDRVKRDVFRWRMEDSLGMATKYGGAWERLLKIDWRN